MNDTTHPPIPRNTPAVAYLRGNRAERQCSHDRVAVTEVCSRLRLKTDVIVDDDADTSTRDTRRTVLGALTGDPISRTHSVLVIPDLAALDSQPGVAAGLLAGLIGSRVCVAVANPEILLRPGQPLSLRALKTVCTAIGEMHIDLERRRRQTGLAEAQGRGVAVGRPGFVWDDVAYAALGVLLEDGKSIRSIGDDGLLSVKMTDETIGQPSSSAIRRALKSRKQGASPETALSALTQALEDGEDEVTESGEETTGSEGSDGAAGSGSTPAAPAQPTA